MSLDSKTAERFSAVSCRQLVQSIGNRVSQMLSSWKVDSVVVVDCRLWLCCRSWVMGLLQLRYEHDSSTIRLRFDYDSATTRYNTHEVFRALAYEIVYQNQW